MGGLETAEEGKDTGERGTREKTKIVQFFNSGNLYFHGVTLINYKIIYNKYKYNQ